MIDIDPVEAFRRALSAMETDKHAPPAPWRRDEMDVHYGSGGIVAETVWPCVGDLMVAARNHGPDVLAALDGLRTERDKLRDGIIDYLGCDVLNAGNADKCAEGCRLCRLLEG